MRARASPQTQCPRDLHCNWSAIMSRRRIRHKAGMVSRGPGPPQALYTTSGLLARPSSLSSSPHAGSSQRQAPSQIGRCLVYHMGHRGRHRDIQSERHSQGTRAQEAATAMRSGGSDWSSALEGRQSSRGMVKGECLAGCPRRHQMEQTIDLTRKGLPLRG